MPLFGRRPAPGYRGGGDASKVRASKNHIRDSLVASGIKVEHGQANQLRRLIQPWQIRSFGYYDQLGEIKFSAQFYERMLAPLKLFAGEKDPATGDVTETQDPDAIAALQRIQDPGGGTATLLGSYGRLMFLAGEAYLLVSKDENDIEQWEMLSTDELRLMDGTYMRYMSPTLPAENYKEAPDDLFEPIDDKAAVAYRLWKRHPRYSALADANLQGVLDLCEELLILTRVVRARGRSRMAGNGILFISDKISPAPIQGGVGDEDLQNDPFMEDLTDTMTAPLADEGTASAVVPLVVRVPVPEDKKLEDLVFHLKLVDPTQLYPETGLRRECIERIAIGLDMPPEILTGLQDSNHWTAWAIDEQTWKGHGQPLAQGLVDNLTAAYFRPYLRSINKPDWQKYVIGYDAAAIINHPDRTKDAKDLYDRRAIGKKALRDASGFSDDDAPTKDELAEMVGIATRDASLAWFGTPAPRGGAIETAPGVIVEGDPAGGGAPDEPGTPSTGAEAEASAPQEEQDAPSETVVGSVLAARIMGGADLAVLRCREVAGNRLVSLAKRNADATARIKSVPTGQVASVLGRDLVKSLGVASESELIVGSRELMTDALRGYGVTDKSVVVTIIDSIERHAVRTLYDAVPPGMPVQTRNRLARMIVATSEKK